MWLVVLKSNLRYVVSFYLSECVGNYFFFNVQKCLTDPGHPPQTVQKGLCRYEKTDHWWTLNSVFEAFNISYYSWTESLTVKLDFKSDFGLLWAQSSTNLYKASNQTIIPSIDVNLNLQGQQIDISHRLNFGCFLYYLYRPLWQVTSNI